MPELYRLHDSSEGENPYPSSAAGALLLRLNRPLTFVSCGSELFDASPRGFRAAISGAARA